MGDLQCPATIIVTSATDATAAQLADELSGRRIAMVFAAPAGAQHQSATDIAKACGCGVRTTEDLTPSGSDAPADDVVGRWAELVDEIADQFRGETVLVVSDARTATLAVPRLTENFSEPPFADLSATSKVFCELESDADGTRYIH